MAYLLAAMRTKSDRAIDKTMRRMCAVWKCIVCSFRLDSVEVSFEGKVPRDQVKQGQGM